MALENECWAFGLVWQRPCSTKEEKISLLYVLSLFCPWEERPVVVASGGPWCGCSSCTERAETSKQCSDVCNLGSHLNWWLRGQVGVLQPTSPVSQPLSHGFVFLSRGRVPRGSQLKWIKYSVLSSKFYSSWHGQAVSGCSEWLQWWPVFGEIRECQNICRGMRLWGSVVCRFLSSFRIWKDQVGNHKLWVHGKVRGENIQQIGNQISLLSPRLFTSMERGSVAKHKSSNYNSRKHTNKSEAGEMAESVFQPPLALVPIQGESQGTVSLYSLPQSYDTHENTQCCSQAAGTQILAWQVHGRYLMSSSKYGTRQKYKYFHPLKFLRFPKWWSLIHKIAASVIIYECAFLFFSNQMWVFLDSPETSSCLRGWEEKKKYVSE